MTPTIAELVIAQDGSLIDDLPERADVDFKGTITINQKKLPFKLHLFRVDKDGWEIGKWNASIDINEPKRTVNHPDGPPESCPRCKEEVASEVAVVVHRWLEDKGFPVATGHKLWWIFNLYFDTQGPITRGKSRRMFYHTETRKVKCPIHGNFTYKKEETDL